MATNSSSSEPQSGGNDPGAPTDEAPGPVPWKRRWLRHLLAFALPLVVLLGLEAGLRWCGFGYPTAFFLRREVGGQPAWVNNWQFGRRFFPSEGNRKSYPLVMPQRKPPGTIRVFVLGESAALGYPAPEYGFSRMLEVLLRDRFPNRKFEVFNLSVVAVNSHVILPIARECARHDGDLWVIYMGNNEEIGPFGGHEVNGVKAPPAALVRASLAIQTWRIGQLLEAALDRLRLGTGLATHWKGMETFTGKSPVARDDPGTHRVWRNFQSNLEAILQAGRKSGVPIILSTLACNLKDCSPFASLHRPDLTAPEQSEWEAAFHKGLEREAGGQFDEALAQYEAAARIDEYFAELQFRMGRCLLSLGRNGEARQHFQRAKDEDAVQFRADTRLNEIIRREAATSSARQVRLLDAEELFAQASPDGIPGRELFYEHVHPMPAGNYLLARATAEAAAGMILTDEPGTSGTNSHAWLSEAKCEEQLGLTDWGRLQALERISDLFNDPPFTSQSIHSNQMQQVSAELRRLRPAIHPAALKRSRLRVEAASASRPTDVDLLTILASMFEAAGDDQAAARKWREIIALQPHAPIPYLELAHLLSRQGLGKDAARTYEECLRQSSDEYVAQGDLGGLYLKQNRPAEAIPHLRALVRHQPQSMLGHYLLGQALARTQQRKEALAEFGKVLELDPQSTEAKQMIAHLSGTN
jgi:tetratricopeptide (TPR) repeat protein